MAIVRDKPAAAGRIPTSAQRPAWRGQAWESITAYLPLLLMFFLALSTWYLVNKTPVSVVEAPNAPLRHEPDYEMSNFSVQRFTPQGGLRARIEGSSMRHYPDTDTLEIDNVRVHAVSADGQVTRATAQRALANGVGTEVQLVGGAEVVHEASAKGEAALFRSEFLHVFLDTERLRTHLPVSFRQGQQEWNAASLEYDHLTRVIELRAVKGSIAPRAKP